MTVRREALILPVTFLTVSLLGGVRIGAQMRLVPPTVTALLLAMLLVGVLVRTGALAPHRLMSASRSPLENASGFVVLLTLFAATAQIFTLVTPDSGLLHVLFGVFFFVQLLTTLAGVHGRRRLLRSLVVLFGAAFVLRFLVLDGLYAPQGGFVKRVVTAILEGVSLGAIDYVPNGPATGYVALLTLALYLIGLTLLPSARKAAAQVGAIIRSPARDLILLVVSATLVWTGCARADVGHAPDPPVPADPQRAASLREASLAAARVWHAPSVPIPDVDLTANPPGPGSFEPSDDVSCRFVVEKVGGTTPKFQCALPAGETIRIKYGHRNPEPYAEVAATRLATALGFDTDHMYLTQRVRCAGCPRFPFLSLRCLARTGVAWACLPGGLDENRTIDFDWAVVERRRPGRIIEATDDQGWGWQELDRIDASRGGSPRSDVDGLRLLAVLLSHWDNKPENQRLVCPPGADRPDGGCAAPIAIVQDLGATFGPLKLDLHNWRRTPIWTDRSSCTISMKTLPYHGGTFPDWRLSEGGRRMLLGLLDQVSDRQVRDLFAASRVTAYDQILAEARNPEAWVAAFRDKVRQIREGGPCSADGGPVDHPSVDGRARPADRLEEELVP